MGDWQAHSVFVLINIIHFWRNAVMLKDDCFHTVLQAWKEKLKYVKKQRHINIKE